MKSELCFVDSDLRAKTTLHLIRLILGFVFLLINGCDRPPAAVDYSTVGIDADRDIFMGGVVSPALSSGDFLVIVELTPAHHPDARKLCDLCRAGHPVRVHLRQDLESASPILVTDITSQGEAIIRCKSTDDAKRIIDQLHAWPSTMQAKGQMN